MLSAHLEKWVSIIENAGNVIVNVPIKLRSKSNMCLWVQCQKQLRECSHNAWLRMRISEIFVDFWTFMPPCVFCKENVTLTPWYSVWFLSYRPLPKKPPSGTTPRGHSPIDGFRNRQVEWWNSTSEIMEWPGKVRPAALWIVLLQCYSQNYQLLSYWLFPKKSHQ